MLATAIQTPVDGSYNSTVFKTPLLYPPAINTLPLFNKLAV